MERPCETRATCSRRDLASVTSSKRDRYSAFVVDCVHKHIFHLFVLVVAICRQATQY